MPGFGASDDRTILSLQGFPGSLIWRGLPLLDSLLNDSVYEFRFAFVCTVEDVAFSSVIPARRIRVKRIRKKRFDRNHFPHKKDATSLSNGVRSNVRQGKFCLSCLIPRRKLVHPKYSHPPKVRLLERGTEENPLVADLVTY